MAVPYAGDAAGFAGAWQHVVVRNGRGGELVAALRARGGLEARPVEAGGARRALVKATVEADDAARRGEGPASPMPAWLGTILAALLRTFGPRGIEFARYSVDYHVLRNFLYLRRHARRGGGAGQPLPAGAAAIVASYDTDGWVSRLLAADPGPGPPGPVAGSGARPALAESGPSPERPCRLQ